MLQNLHVKNLALIDECEVEFSDGLNILSGETGAGKSIIIGSINLALGEKVQKEMLRDNEKPAFVELIFSVDNRCIDIPSSQSSGLRPDSRLRPSRSPDRAQNLCSPPEKSRCFAT